MECFVKEMKVLQNKVAHWEREEQEAQLPPPTKPEMSSILGFQPMHGMQADPSLGDRDPSMDLPPGFNPMATTTLDDTRLGTRYSPTVQQVLHIEQTGPHVQWSNPLAIGQDAQPQETSTQDISFGEVLRPTQSSFKTTQNFPSISSLH